MKKTVWLAAILAVSLVFSFISCRNSSGGNSDDTSATSNNGSATSDDENGGADGTGSDTTPAGFVAVEGTTVTGGNKFNSLNQPDNSFKGVFIEGRTVTIANFYMSDHEVTQAEFQTVMGANPSSFDGSTGKEASDGETQTNRPVENVSWYMAIAYCNKKSLVDNLTPCYSVNGVSDWATLAFSAIPTDRDTNWNNVTCNFSANGYRLPTEVEWEYAALGGKNGVTAADPTDYGGTNDSSAIGNYAWYNENSANKTHEVKKKTKNALGLYDMSGNVLEWCYDWYNSSVTAGDNGNATVTNPTGPASGTYRVFRGGDWESPDGFCTVSYRGSSGHPTDCADNIGFRVVRSSN